MLASCSNSAQIVNGAIPPQKFRTHVLPAWNSDVPNGITLLGKFRQYHAVGRAI